MNIREAVEADKNAWNDVLSSAKEHSFLQSWEWGVFQQALNMPIWRFVLEDNGTIKGIALVIRHSLPMGQSWLYIPHGPIVQEDVNTADVLQMFQSHLTKLAAKESVMFVRIDPLLLDAQKHIFLHTGFMKAPKEVQPKDTLVLNLQKSDEELLAEMHKKTRYNIRLAEKKGVTVRFSTDQKDVQAFIALTKQVADRTNFHFHPDAYYLSLIKELANAGMAEIALAEHEGDLLAAHIMIYCNGKATYAHGASSLNKKQLMGPALLYWRTIKRAKEKGCTEYDFYGIAPEGASETHPWAGVTRMKLGFGGKQVSYVGAYDLTFKPTAYFLFNLAKKIRSAFN